jgi:uncharacterized protein (DUF1697 family)
MVAFLRGVNIGGRTVLKDQLRTIATQAGMRDVDTFIASGNLIFTAPAGSAADHETRLTSQFIVTLGYDVDVFVRPLDALPAIAAAQPFTAARHASATVLNIGFLHAPLTAAAKKALLAHQSDVDDFAVAQHEVRWLCQSRQSESPFFKVSFEKLIGAPATWRNRNTVQRLVAKYISA